jgi:hypothetical protein
VSDLNGHGEKLSRRQELLIAALLETDTLAQAAERARVSTATIRRWMQLPQFRAAYQRAKRDLIEAATNRLLKTMGKAAQKLESVMDDPKAPLGWQVSAATRILDRGRWAYETDDLAERIAQLEDQQQRREG